MNEQSILNAISEMRRQGIQYDEQTSKLYNLQVVNNLDEVRITKVVEHL